MKIGIVGLGYVGLPLAVVFAEEGHDVVGYDGMTAYYNLKLKEARHAALAQFPGFRPVIGMLEDRDRLNEAGRL